MQYLHYFISTELPQTVTFYNSNFSKLNKIIRLSRYPQSIISEVMGGIVKKTEENNLRAEIIHNSLNNSVCGVIIPEISAGVYCDMFSGTDYNEYKNRACETFSKAKKIHDKQEEIYIKNTDFDRLCELAKVAEQMFFSVKKQGEDVLQGREIHRFFGAITANGNVNYIQQITAELKHRYFIKGRPGTGKSTFLKKLAAAGVNAGYDVEMYHCALDPKSLDMIIVRELGLCVFDSTSPHEYFPERLGDGIIDIYGLCVAPGTDERFSTELEILQQKYNEIIAEGRVLIRKINESIIEEENTVLPLNNTERELFIEEVIKSLF